MQGGDRKLNLSHAAPDRFSFPSDFLFGAATASNFLPFEPASAASPVDTYLARLFDRNYNHAALEVMETGQCRLPIPGFVQHDVTHPPLPSPLDYADVNHYYRFLAGIQFLPRDKSLLGFDPWS